MRSSEDPIEAQEDRPCPIAADVALVPFDGLVGYEAAISQDGSESG
jgi:hypothetical protein